MTDKHLTHRIIGAAISVHRELSPGLLEGGYEECLCCELTRLGMPFEQIRWNYNPTETQTECRDTEGTENG